MQLNKVHENSEKNKEQLCFSIFSLSFLSNTSVMIYFFCSVLFRFGFLIVGLMKTTAQNHESFVHNTI